MPSSNDLVSWIFAHVHSGIMRKRKKGVRRKQRGDWERRRRKEAINKERRNTLNVEKGEELMLALMQKLVADKRFGEIERIKDDKDYRLILYREYHII